MQGKESTVIKMEYTYISSRQNPTVMRFATLKDKKGRDAEGLFIAEGKKLCSEAVGHVNVRFALLCEEKKGSKELIRLCERSGGEIIVLSEGAFSKLSSDTAPDGVIFICNASGEGSVIGADEKIFILENVRDPGNVGTIIRTAAAFGCDRLILSDCADIYNPKVVRATMGAVFKMKFTVCKGLTEILSLLKSEKRRIIASALRSDALVAGEVKLCPSDCIIIGNEGHGVSEETLKICSDVIYIPMSGKTESLNAASAAAVLMWEHFKACGSK